MSVKFLFENLLGREHSGDLGEDKMCRDLNQIKLSQDTVQLLVVVKTVMDLWVA
jgi:hypothetical protein